MEKLALNQPKFHVVCYNGSAGFLLEVGKEPELLYIHNIAKETTSSLLNFASELGMTTKHYDAANRKDQIIRPTDEVPDVGEAAKFLLFSKDMEKLTDKFSSRFPPDMFHVLKGTDYIELLPGGVNKGDNDS